MSTVEEFREFQPADSYDGYNALLIGAGTQHHVVDTTTFDNSNPVIGPEGGRYDGYSANIGQADALCGRELVGRMLPLKLDSTVLESHVCGTCLRALTARSTTEADR